MPPNLSLLCVVEDPAISPSSRLRIYNHLDELNGSGIKTEVVLQPKKSGEWKSLLRQARSYDALLWQKVLISQWDVIRLRTATKCLLFDLDDAVWMGKKNHVPYRSGKQARRFWFFTRNLDGAICGSPYLEHKIRSISSSVQTSILPTSVPSLPFKAREGRGCSIPLVVWIGMGPNVSQVEAIEGELAAAYAENPFLLRIVSNRPPNFRGFRSWEFVEWDENAEYDLIAPADVGIMPLVDDGFTRGKCAYKALQYMACGIPVVASDVGVNREWISETGAGLVVSIGGWAEALGILLSEADRRNAMGLRGWEVVQDRFSHECVGLELSRALREMIPIQ